MPICNSYLIPGSIYEAIEILVSYGSEARIIAGGTDLLLEIQQGIVAPPNVLVDITRISDCNKIQLADGKLFVGSVVPLSEIGKSTLVFQHARALYEAVSLIGGPQVRNMATLGGNVAHSLPAADGSIALSCLDVNVEIASPEGLSCLPLPEIFRSVGKNTLWSNQFITGFYIPIATPLASSGFNRIMRPQGVALPVLNMAIWLKRMDDMVGGIRIAVGPAGLCPFRIRALEEYLIGKQKTDDNMRIAIKLLRENTNFRSSKYRASSQYRSHLVESLFLDLFCQCWDRTVGQGN